MYQPLLKLITQVSTTFTVKNTCINHFSSREHTFRLSFVATCCDSHPFSVFNFQHKVSKLESTTQHKCELWRIKRQLVECIRVSSYIKAAILFFNVAINMESGLHCSWTVYWPYLATPLQIQNTPVELRAVISAVLRSWAMIIFDKRK
jgi:hypothetical protein